MTPIGAKMDARLEKVAYRIASSLGANSVAKSLVNMFVLQRITQNLNDGGLRNISPEDILTMDLYSSNSKHVIHDLIQKISNVINELPTSGGMAGAPHYIPDDDEKPLYEAMVIACRRRKIANPDFGLIYNVAGELISELIDQVDKYVSDSRNEFSAVHHTSANPLMERHDYGSPGGPSVPRGASSRLAVLVRRVNPKTDTKQWALVSPELKDKSGKRKVLEWYGSRKPSGERVKNTESRIRWFSDGPGRRKPRKKKKSRKASTVSFPGFCIRIAGNRMSSIYDTPDRSEIGAITAKSLFEQIASQLDGSAVVVYDTETTGLTERLPRAQITQISASAVEFPDVARGIINPQLIDEYHSTAELSDDSVSDLDAPQADKGWTTRQTLDFNRYDLPSFEQHKRVSLPQPPADYKPPGRKQTIQYPEYGPQFHVPSKGMTPGFKPESGMLQGFVDFIAGVKSKYPRILLVAHNPSFDRKFLAARCSLADVDPSVLKSCENLDSQAFMKVYVEPVLETMDDSTLRDRFKELTKSKPNMFNLDYVNSAFGTLKSLASHTSNVDVEALIKALSKCLHILAEAGDLDVTDAYRKSVRHRHDIENRDTNIKQRKFDFKKKYLIVSPGDPEALKRLKLELHKVKSSNEPKSVKDAEIDRIIREIDSML